MRYLAAALVSILIAVSPATSAEVTLRLGHAALELNPWHDGSVRFREAVKRRTNGAVEVQIYPARQLGDNRETMDGTKFGTIDLTLADASGFAPVQNLHFPWMITSYAHLARVAQLPETRAMLEPKLAAEGLVMLTLYEAGRVELISRRAISSFEQLKGIKARVPPVRMHLELWQALGTNPTPVPYGEIYTALETGTIDAFGSNITSIYGEKFYEAAKNILLTNQHFWPALLIMNKKKFDSLKPEYQVALREAAAETVGPQVLAVQKAEDAVKEKLRAAGVTFRELTPEFRAKLKAAVQPVIDKYAKTDPTISPFIAAVEKVAD